MTTSCARAPAFELAKRAKLLEHALLGFLEVHRNRVGAFDLDDELGPIYELALVVADDAATLAQAPATDEPQAA